MAYVYSVVLVVFACRNLRGERLATRVLRLIAPAIITSVTIAALLTASFGAAVLIRTILPLGGAAAYRALHYGFFSASGRQFWAPAGLPFVYYMIDFSGFWIMGTLFLICSGVAAVLYLANGAEENAADALRNEIIATCALLHVAFIALFFGNQWSWIYYSYFLTVGVAAAAGASAVQRRVTMGLCLMGILAWTDVVFWELRWWQTRERDEVTAGLWASPDERDEWRRILDAVHLQSAVMLDTKGAIELIAPGFEKPVSLYLDFGLMAPADIQRKVEQISEAQMVVVPVGGIEACRGIPAAPEFDAALKSFEPRIKGKFFDVYQRPGPPISPASK